MEMDGWIDANRYRWMDGWIGVNRWMMDGYRFIFYFLDGYRFR